MIARKRACGKQKLATREAVKHPTTSVLVRCSKGFSASTTFTEAGNENHTLGADVTELQHQVLHLL